MYIIICFLYVLQKPESNIDMYPLGGILSPQQIVAFDFFSYFTDSGLYKYTIEISINHHNEALVIPAFFRIDGIPLIFDPPLKNNLNLGPVYFKKTPLNVPVKVKNFGSRVYNLRFAKINPSRFECDLNHM